MLQRSLILSSILGILMCPYVCSGHVVSTCFSAEKASTCCQVHVDNKTVHCCNSDDCSDTKTLVSPRSVFHTAPFEHDYCSNGNCVLSTATSVSQQISRHEINLSWMNLLQYSTEVVIPHPINLATNTEKMGITSEDCFGAAMRLTISSLLI